jgi:DNA-binding IclR family transcriptional regulator
LRAVSRETITDPRTLERAIAAIRRDGVAIAPGSIQSVSTGVAVPLRHEGEVVAALSVVLPRDADPTPSVAALRSAVAGIESDLRRQRL